VPDIYLGEFFTDIEPPYVINRVPGPGATDVLVTASVTFDILDLGGSGVDQFRTTVTFNGTPVITNGIFQSGYSGTFTPIPTGFTVTITPDDGFPYNGSVTVYITGGDLNPLPNLMVPVSWSFAIEEELIAPHVSNNTPVGQYQALDAHVTFDISDDGPLPLDPSSIVVTIGGVTAYAGNVQLNSFVVITTPIVGGLHFDIQAPADWTAGLPVTVTVDADDTFNTMPTFSWQFTGTTLGIKLCSPADPLPVEVRLRDRLPSSALERLRQVAITMVSTDRMTDHRLRAITILAHRNDLGALFADVLAVSPDILAEDICRPRKLFEMAADVDAVRVEAQRALIELRAMGLSPNYQQLLDARLRSSSPQHRVTALCAIVVIAAVFLLNPRAGVTTTTDTLTFPAPPLPTPVYDIVIDQTVSDEVCFVHPLMPAEMRLLAPFDTPGLEELRRAMLDALSRDPQLTRRARAVLLTAYKNDFAAVFADLMTPPPEVLAEIVCRRRKLFAVAADLKRADAAWTAARRELKAKGLSANYVALLEARAFSGSPQYRVSAACATLLLGALLFP
jgi:hypothetical protein